MRVPAEAVAELLREQIARHGGVRLLAEQISLALDEERSTWERRINAILSERGDSDWKGNTRYVTEAVLDRLLVGLDITYLWHTRFEEWYAPTAWKLIRDRALERRALREAA